VVLVTEIRRVLIYHTELGAVSATVIVKHKLLLNHTGEFTVDARSKVLQFGENVTT